MNLAEKSSAICAIILLTSCATEVPADRGVPVQLPQQAKIIDNSCDWVKIITVSPKDVLTPETAKQILTHDQTVKKNCPKAVSY